MVDFDSSLPGSLNVQDNSFFNDLIEEILQTEETCRSGADGNKDGDMFADMFAPDSEDMFAASEGEYSPVRAIKQTTPVSVITPTFHASPTSPVIGRVVPDIRFFCYPVSG